MLDLRFACGPQCRHRQSFDTRAGCFGTPRRRFDNAFEDRAKTVMARRGQVIGLGRGKQHFIDFLAEDQRQPTVGAGAEGLEHTANGALEFVQSLRALVECAKHIDEHDLPVEAAEMTGEERADDLGLIAFETPGHH